MQAEPFEPIKQNESRATYECGPVFYIEAKAGEKLIKKAGCASQLFLSQIATLVGCVSSLRFLPLALSKIISLSLIKCQANRLI
jgi:hypothetical protein